ncbi:MAG: hypothetical protein NTX66_04555 [Candidatus Falkowbacteria bacterium]|nr:hypothetical protein [Candidatus Falkowbacteria bacterium]
MTEHPDSQKGEAVLKVCDNLTSLSTKLEKANKQAPPDTDLIRKLRFQIEACRKGLDRIQSKTGNFTPA